MQYGPFNAKQINNHLQRVLVSEEFAKAPRLGKFLNYVVEETVSKKPTAIRGYVIAVEVFGKGAEFDPSDPYVRNIARLTRKALETYYINPAEEDVLRIDVPPGNYIATFCALDETLQRANSAARSEPSRLIKLPRDFAPGSREQRKLIEGIETPLPMLAVVPFENVGITTEENSLIGDLIASEIISGLSPSAQLNVMSRLTTTQFKDSVTEKSLLADKLNADYVLSGTYRKIQNKLIVNAEIADLSSLAVIWAETDSYDLNDVQGPHSHLTNHLIKQASQALLRHEVQLAATEPMESLQLHTMLIAGINYMHCVPEHLFRAAYDLFQQILKVHPNHPTVHTLLAQWHIYTIHRSDGWAVGEDQKHREVATFHCEHALQINPSHPLALATFGLVQTQFQKDPDGGLEYYNTAEKFNPNEPCIQAYKSAVLSYKGNGPEAVKCAQRAIHLSPFDPQLHLFKACAAAAEFACDNLEAAEEHAMSSFSLNPNHTSNIRLLVAVQVDLGKHDQAKLTASKLMEQDPSFTTSSYLSRSPNAAYACGQRIASSLESAGVPRI